MELKHSGTPDHPDLEDLAAFIDGRLDTEECARIRAHLGRCEECYETFVETVRFERELGAAAREQPIPFPSDRRRWEPRRWMPAASLAAAAVLLLAVGLPVYRSLTSPTALAPDEIIASVREEAPALLDQTWPPAQRGHGTNTPTDEEQSFRMGVEVVNFQLALEAGERDRSRQAAARIGALLEETPLAGEELKSFYRGVFDTLGSESESPAQFLEAAAAHGKDGFEQQVTFLDLRHFELGKWAEAGRLAALAGKPELFSRRDTRRFLRRLRGEERERIDDPQIQEDLDGIAEILDRGELRDEDYRALESAFKSILRTYYPS